MLDFKRYRSLTMSLIRTGTLDESVEKYDKALKTLNDHVLRECKDEIDEFERARQKVERKLRAVQNSDAVGSLEEAVYECEDRMHTKMRSMAREIGRLQDEIENDKSLDEKTRSARLKSLADTTNEEYKRLHDKFPAVMRAQMLHQVQRLL